jgi:hypothetical protein
MGISTPVPLIQENAVASAPRVALIQQTGEGFGAVMMNTAARAWPVCNTFSQGRLWKPDKYNSEAFAG